MTTKAKILDSFPDNMGRPPIYPWDEWTDGKVRELVKGQDFDSQLKSMQTLIHRTAALYGMRAKTALNENRQSITMTFYYEGS